MEDLANKISARVTLIKAGSKQTGKSDKLWAKWLRSGGCQPRQKHFDHGELVVCIRCGSDWVVPVMYGHPSEAAEEAARRGALAMGGCCMPRWGQQNHWCCKSCKFRWPGEFEEWDPDTGKFV